MKSILIFVKAPVPGYVKTRLAKSVGQEKAARLYRAMARDTVTAARSVPKASVVIAYKPHSSASQPKWLIRSKSWFSQRGKGLGGRLVHAFRHAFQNGSGPVIAIGSDLPHLTPGLLQKAFRHLQETHVVIGPSRDGGYYLIGLRVPQPQLFRGISWSSPKVFRQTLRAVKRSRLTFRLLPTHKDIDTIKDVDQFKESLRFSRGGKHFHRTRSLLRV